MAEAGPATREHVDDTLGAYSATFHAPFFLIDGPSVSASKEELYRWLNWRVFYGRPRDEYPDAEKDQDTAIAIKAIVWRDGLFLTHKAAKVHTSWL